MDSQVEGVFWALGALFSWGTALIFLKFDCVKQANIHPLVLTSFYSFGYLVAGLVSFAVYEIIGTSIAITAYGMLGGAIWGIGKLLTIIAVTGPIGISIGQAIQCCCTILTSFLAGVFTGEEVTLFHIMGVVVLAAGLVMVASTGTDYAKTVLANQSFYGEKIESTACESDPLRPESAQALNSSVGGGCGTMGFMCLAGISGVFLALAAVPFKLSGSTDASSYAISQALGQFLTLSTVTLGYFGSTMLTTQSLVSITTSSLRRTFAIGTAAGLAGGFLLFAAAFCNTHAVNLIGLIGATLGATNMIVAGIWGIALFEEIRDCNLITLFFSGSIIALSGAFFLEWQPGV